ncbi:hypothetical protein [Myxococcus fulvus]|uniref:hypothetical protein n=1 Tax=Myxococcus fulvus TaxID=33 RepID=UPI0020BE094A|nr:hypothetical protein [Myxococcus fulvus]MCK8502395.1 hypothetical protein [Myxococcus fulvus]
MRSGVAISTHSLGAYFQLGFGRSPDACFEALCGATVVRYGLELDYRFRPGEFVSPWVGVGIGYQFATAQLVSDDGERLAGSRQRRGFDLGHANAGLDLRLNRTLSVGPYVSTSLGRYRKTDSVDIPGDSRRFHVWIQPGVRMQLHF